MIYGRLRQTLVIATACFSVVLIQGIAPKISNAHEVAPAMSAPVALKTLRDGNGRYIGGTTKALRDSARRKDLVGGQAPSAIILSCSDSRVPPEIVFDRGLGDLFAIRVAGNVLGAASVASIEYAVEHLGTHLIVVMGHESCGAVKAAITTPKNQSAGSPDLDTLIASVYLDPKDHSSLTEDPRLRKQVIFNVNGVSDQLVKRSAIVRKAVEEGKVTIVRGIYGLSTGKVDFWATESLEKPAPTHAFNEVR